MSSHSELRDLRSDGVHFKNKCKFMIPKSTVIPQINEAFVGSQRKYKIYITMSIQFCYDVSFIGTIFSRNWHLLFVLSFFSFKFQIWCLCSCCSHYWYLFNLIFRRSFFGSSVNTTQKCAANYQTYLENQLNNFWTWNNGMLMKYHTGESAQFGGQVLGTPRLTDWLTYLLTYLLHGAESFLRR